MQKNILSNIYSKNSLALIISLAAVACSPSMAETNYTSSIDGYEQRVSEVNYAKARDIKSSSDRFARVGAPPVIINNPLAISESIGSGLASSGGFTNGVFMPSQASGGSAYGSLNSGVIQQGIFMQNSTQGYVPPANFGNNYLSPTRR